MQIRLTASDSLLSDRAASPDAAMAPGCDAQPIFPAQRFQGNPDTRLALVDILHQIFVGNITSIQTPRG